MAQPDLDQVAQKFCEERDMRFVKRVGEGTFKQTFEVVGTDGITVALKLYKAATLGPREQREIDAMLRCNHQNIARLLSVHRYDYQNTPFVALTEEFLPGGTLTSKGKVTKAECLRISGQLIDALAHTSGLSLVHRDIKPDNIMFRQDGRSPVLTDFGVARDLLESSLTPTWAPHGPGTPFFAPPEQLNNQKQLIDWRSDQFSLGIAMAYVTLGSHPYLPVGGSDTDVVEAVAARKGPSKEFIETSAAIGLPALQKMVAPWPVHRYRKPELLAEAWHSQEGTP